MQKITSDNLNNFFNKKFPVVFFHAHCDDESFLNAGLISSLINDGFQVYLVYFASAVVPGQDKTIVRQNELKKSCDILGVKNIIFLDYCEPKYDPGFSKPLFLQSEEIIIKNLESKMSFLFNSKINIISYDKNGGYGNKDHIKSHKVGRLFLENHGDNIESFFEVTINRNLYLDWTRANANMNVVSYLPKLEYWSKEFGLPVEEISHGFELETNLLKIKKRALAAHESQIKPNEFPLILEAADFKGLFGVEPLKMIK